MSGQNIDRKIAVIFTTDIIGFSKHMEADESETIFAVHECEVILLGLFKKYGGRLLNTGSGSFFGQIFQCGFYH